MNAINSAKRGTRKTQPTTYKKKGKSTRPKTVTIQSIESLKIEIVDTKPKSANAKPPKRHSKRVLAIRINFETCTGASGTIDPPDTRLTKCSLTDLDDPTKPVINALPNVTLSAPTWQTTFAVPDRHHYRLDVDGDGGGHDDAIVDCTGIPV